MRDPEFDQNYLIYCQDYEAKHPKKQWNIGPLAIAGRVIGLMIGALIMGHLGTGWLIVVAAGALAVAIGRQFA